MSGSPAVIAHLEQVLAYYDDPAQAPHAHPPPVPNSEIAAELCVTAVAIITRIIEYRRTGQLPDQEPSVQTKLDVAEMFDRYLEVRDDSQ